MGKVFVIDQMIGKTTMEQFTSYLELLLFVAHNIVVLNTEGKEIRLIPSLGLMECRFDRQDLKHKRYRIG